MEETEKHLYQVYGALIQNGTKHERWFFAAYNGGRLLERIDGEPSRALEELAKDVIYRSWSPKAEEAFSVGLTYDLPAPSRDNGSGITPFALSEEEQKLFGERIHKAYEEQRREIKDRKNIKQEGEQAKP